MAGTLTLSLAQQFDIDGSPLAGCLLYFFQVGTVGTLQNSYQDYGLTIVNPNPLQADEYGRIPNFYLADGQVHVRLTDASGVVIPGCDQVMQVIGPSSGGGGGGGAVDPTTIATSGDFKWRPTSEILTGWVKANGQTIGSATSGASQRANADTLSLYVYLWNNFTDAHCPVAGGRGVSGLADFNATKTIGLPDMRARLPVGLDDMGSAPSGRLSPYNIDGLEGVTTPAAHGGETNHTLILNEAPQGLFTFNDPQHAHAIGMGTTGVVFGSGGVVNVPTPVSGPGSLSNIATFSSYTGAWITDHAGGGQHNNMPPFLLGTWYCKL